MTGKRKAKAARPRKAAKRTVTTATTARLGQPSPAEQALVTQHRVKL